MLPYLLRKLDIDCCYYSDGLIIFCEQIDKYLTMSNENPNYVLQEKIPEVSRQENSSV
jgi:hypothetical protein